MAKTSDENAKQKRQCKRAFKDHSDGLRKTQWDREFSNSLRFCMRKNWTTLLRKRRSERAFT